jgi:large subunit ribosomal protein L27Ae
MRRYHLLRNRLWRPAVNVDRLWSLVTEQHRLAYEKRTDVAPVIDVVKAVFIFYLFIFVIYQHIFFTFCNF